MTSAVESGEISLTLPDGSVRKVSAGTTGADLAMAISPRLAKAALAVVVDDRLTDLTRPFDADARVRIITERDPEALHLYRHSTAHLLAAAVLELFPGTQCGIGPALDDGFYYDFVVQRPFVPEDLAAIEQRMREIAARDLPFVRELRPKEDAKAYFAARGEPLKVQLIEEKSGPIASCYDIKGVFLDFCVGPHVPSVGKLGHFKLLSTSNAYWKGDAKNQPMQRVYGTAFFSKGELEQYLNRLEEAKKRDHRKLGKDLGLFHFHPWAPGAAFWLAKGTTVYHTIGNYMRDVLLPNGYVELKTPLMFNKALWETSGHWQHYRQNMFLIDNDEEQMAMKAMNCPGHMLVFASETRSYRDLPLRFHEQTPLHRNEASGVLSGLTRVRQFSQDDAHCFVMESQIGEEVERLLRLVQRVYGDFGLEYSVKLSTRPAEFLGEIATWDHAEAELKRALESAGQAYTVDAGDGAFYGPKIDVDVTDAIGRKWQCATIQLDYQLPQRFDLKYTGADNAEHRPVVIHRAIFGSFERFMALLIEHYAGAFPLWLAPVQATVLPLSDRHLDAAKAVAATLEAGGLRVTVDARVEKIGYKIREAQLQQIPYMLVLGDREAAEGTVSVRSRRGGDLGARPSRPSSTMPGGKYSRRGGSYRIRQRQAAAPGRSGADQRPNPRSRSARHRRNRRSAGHHGPAGRHSHRALQGTRSRGGLGHGRASGVSHHRLRPLPVQRAEAGPSGAEAPEDHRGQRDQVPAEGRRARLRLQEEAHRALPGRGRQGQGDGVLPRPGNRASGDRPPHPGAVDPGSQRAGHLGERAEARGQHDAHDPRPEAAAGAAAAGAAGRERRRPATRGEHGVAERHGERSRSRHGSAGRRANGLPATSGE